VPRIVGFRFLEEPQTNWRTIDTKKTFGHEPAHTWGNPRTRGCTRKRTHAASIATCVTIPVPHHPPRPERSCRRRRYRRRSQSSPLSSKSSKNPPSRAPPSRPHIADPFASSIARHRRRRSTGSLAFLEIPRDSLLLFPCVRVCVCVCVRVCVCVCVCVSARYPTSHFPRFFPSEPPFSLRPFSLRLPP